MRKYTPKGSVQKRAAYTNRFKVVPSVPRKEVVDDASKRVLDRIESSGIGILDAYIEIDQLVIEIDSRDNYETLRILKEECCYRMCSELSAIDYLHDRGEFEIFYQMLNLDEARRVRVATTVKKGEAIESIVPLFAMANFAEREMYDMFGIPVNGHPYLKRLLMPEDWQGHPLLKSYPLQGDEFAAWYEIDKIFGKEYREVVGPEIRDPARIDRGDTRRYSRVGHEVPFGADPADEESLTPIEYSENFMVNYNKSSKMLDKRK